MSIWLAIIGVLYFNLTFFWMLQNSMWGKVEYTVVTIFLLTALMINVVFADHKKKVVIEKHKQEIDKLNS